MPKSIIAEGKTTEQAVENGLRSLKVSKESVTIKVIENEDKRSFFSILAPRVVKVELTLKENINFSNRTHKEYHVDEKQLNNGIKTVKEFMDDFAKKINANITIEVKKEENYISVIINGEDSNFLIGYKGEVLNSLQVILSSIINKNNENKIKITLDIANFREKRKKILEELAEKISKTVVRTGKQITLEPMSSYERKVIHDKLQDSNTVKTYSLGEDPYRRIVVSLK